VVADVGGAAGVRDFGRLCVGRRIALGPPDSLDGQDAPAGEDEDQEDSDSPLQPRSDFHLAVR